MKKGTIYLTVLLALLAGILIAGCNNPTDSNNENNYPRGGAETPAIVVDEREIITAKGPGTFTPAMWADSWTKTGQKTLILDCTNGATGIVFTAGVYTVPNGGTLKIVGSNVNALDFNNVGTIILNAAYGDIVLDPFADIDNVVAAARIFVKDEETKDALVATGVAAASIGLRWDTRDSLDDLGADAFITGWSIRSPDDLALLSTTHTLYAGSIVATGDVDLSNGEKLTLLGDTLDLTQPSGVLTARSRITYTGGAGADIPVLDLNGYAVTLANTIGITKITSSSKSGSALSIASGDSITADIDIDAGKDITLNVAQDGANMAFTLANLTGDGALIVQGAVTAATVTAGTGNITFAGTKAATPLTTASFANTAVTFKSPVAITPAVVFNGPAVFADNAVFANTATFTGAATFKKVLTPANTLTFGGATAITTLDGKDLTALTIGGTGTVTVSSFSRPTAAATLTANVATLSLPGFTLVDDFTIAGTGNVVLTSKPATSAADLILNSTGTLTLAAGATITTDGGITLSGGTLTIPAEIPLVISGDGTVGNSTRPLSTGTYNGVTMTTAATTFTGDAIFPQTATLYGGYTFEGNVTFNGDVIFPTTAVTLAAEKTITLAADRAFKYDATTPLVRAGGTLKLAPLGATTLTVTSGQLGLGAAAIDLTAGELKVLAGIVLNLGNTLNIKNDATLTLNSSSDLNFYYNSVTGSLTAGDTAFYNFTGNTGYWEASASVTIAANRISGSGTFTAYNDTGFDIDSPGVNTGLEIDGVDIQLDNGNISLIPDEEDIVITLSLVNGARISGLTGNSSAGTVTVVEDFGGAYVHPENVAVMDSTTGGTSFDNYIYQADPGDAALFTVTGDSGGTAELEITEATKATANGS